MRANVPVAPAINTFWPLLKLPMSAAPTVTTAGLALLTAVTATTGPAGVVPPSHDQTPSAPLTITVNLATPRLAKLVHDQSSEVKPVMRSAPVSASASLWLVAASSFGFWPYQGISTAIDLASACVDCST